MSEKARKMSKIKLIMGVMIPVFVMISTLVMVSVSFAWFSDSAEVFVQSIDLTTKEVFTLDFSVGQTAAGMYNGQKVLDDDLETVSAGGGYLRSKYRYLTEGKLEAYYRDSAFMFGTEISLSTQSIPVDMTIKFNFAEVTQRDGNWVNQEFIPSGAPYDMIIYGTTSNNDKILHPVQELDANKIPYAYTWFFVPHGQTINNATVVYSPYGALTLGYTAVDGTNDSYRYALTKNGNAVTNSTSIQDETPSGLSHFSSGEFTYVEIGLEEEVAASERYNYNSEIGQYVQNNSGTYKIVRAYDFYIVFAPEKLFWMQYFPADRDKPYAISGGNGGVYTSTELTNYILAPSEDKMYYAATTYTGATFYFTVEIDVTTIYWPED